MAVADDDVCDGVDNNCTDGTDADHPARMFFADADNDTFGDATVHDGAGCSTVPWDTPAWPPSPSAAS